MGDSRYINLDIKQNEEIDVVMIDGGHTYEIVMNDFYKFGKKLGLVDQSF